MKTEELLEQDKEKLISRLSQADTADQAIKVMEEELNHILYRCGDLLEGNRAAAEASTQIALPGLAALISFDVAKSALSLTDGNGEIQIVQKTPLSSSGGSADSRTARFMASPLFLSIGGIGLDMAGALLLLTSSGNALSALLHAAGLAAIGCGGWFLYRAGRQKSASLPAASLTRGPEVSVQVKPDPEKLYHHLKNLLTVIDHTIEETAQREALLPGAVSRSAAEGGPESGAFQTAVLSSVPDLTDDEIVLFSGLLEQCYALGEDLGAHEMISEIRYHLHRHGIGLADYDPAQENASAAWFDQMPAGKTQTLRPALVRSGDGQGTDGKLICKGLCTVRK